MKELMRFMLTWSLNYSQVDASEINGKREELENLRKVYERITGSIRKK